MRIFVTMNTDLPFARPLKKTENVILSACLENPALALEIDIKLGLTRGIPHIS